MLSAGIVLAGGHSTRLGQDKRCLQLWGPEGPTLLAHTVALATVCCREVIVVLNDPEHWPDIQARIVPDAYPGTGPLGGLASGLAAITTDRALLLACDMPLLQLALLRALVAAPLVGDALVLRRPAAWGEPRRNQHREPLIAVYSQACLPGIRACLDHNERRMAVLLDQLTVHYLDSAWWRRFDADGRSFLNLNRSEDLTQAKRLLGR
ncbi:MAG: molybdenum cofactor guanylyltransferase [Oscillochloris sp.]|nr:molybdenum cofactor guanylyltransferase [Oscillochloris sp.]